MQLQVVYDGSLQPLPKHMTRVRITQDSIVNPVTVSRSLIKKGLLVATTSQFSSEEGMYGTNYRVTGGAVQTKDNLIRKGAGWGFTYHGFKSSGELHYMLLGLHVWRMMQPCSYKDHGAPGHLCDEVVLVEPPVPAIITQMASALQPGAQSSKPAAADSSGAIGGPSQETVGATSENDGTEAEVESDGHGSDALFDDLDDEVGDDQADVEPRKELPSTPDLHELLGGQGVRLVKCVEPSGRRYLLVCGLSEESAVQLVSGWDAPRQKVRAPLLDLKAVARFAISRGKNGFTQTLVLRKFGPWGPSVNIREEPDYQSWVNSFRFLTEGGKLAKFLKAGVDLPRKYTLEKAKQTLDDGRIEVLKVDGEPIWVVQ